MEKLTEIPSSAELVISKIINKEAVITVTLNNPLERGNDTGRVAGSMPRHIDDGEEVGTGSKRRKLLSFISLPCWSFGIDETEECSAMFAFSCTTDKTRA